MFTGNHREILSQALDRVQIKFFTRPGCQLCTKSLHILRALESRFHLEIEQVDISQSPELLEAYQFDIPVATLEGEELFRHRADAGKMEKVLEARARDNDDAGD